MVTFGLILLGLEAFFSLLCGFVFWHFWSRSAMKRSIARTAIAIYALGCLGILLLMFFLPL
jgi:hypothetical protein